MRWRAWQLVMWASDGSVVRGPCLWWSGVTAEGVARWPWMAIGMGMDDRGEAAALGPTASSLRRLEGESGALQPKRAITRLSQTKEPNRGRFPREPVTSAS
jgi:hypothetical protein